MISLILLPAVFLLDLQLPLGVAIGILYVVPVLLTLRAHPALLWLVTGLACLLVLIAIPMSPAEPDWIALANRGLSLLAIVVSALLLRLHRRREQSLVQHVRKEEILQESERYLRQVIDLVPHRIFVKDAEGRFLLVNQAAAAAYGLSVEAMTGRLHRELHGDPGQVNQMLADDRAVIESGCIRLNPEERFTGADGVPRTLRTAKIPFRLSGHGETAVMGLAIDITEDKARERRLLASERKYRALLDNAVDAILLADMEGNLIDANRQAEQLLGYSRDELSRMHAADLHPPEELPHLLEVFRTLRESDTTLVTHPVIRGNGELIRCEVAATLIRYGDEAVAQGIFRDITERERKMQARLEEEQRHRTTLIREVHHRIKNNLQGAVGLLRQQAGAHPELEEAMAGAIGQIQSIALVHGLQSKGDDLKVWLCEMIQAIARAAAPLTRAPVEHRINLGEGEPVWVHSDFAVPVALVINELTQNAAKHGNGGVIRIELQRGTDNSALVLVSNQGWLPQGFDFAHGKNIGTGLELVRALLPHQGAQLTFEQNRDEVRACLQLMPPILRT